MRDAIQSNRPARRPSAVLAGRQDPRTFPGCTPGIYRSGLPSGAAHLQRAALQPSAPPLLPEGKQPRSPLDGTRDAVSPPGGRGPRPPKREPSTGVDLTPWGASSRFGSPTLRHPAGAGVPTGARRCTRRPHPASSRQALRPANALGRFPAGFRQRKARCRARGQLRS